VVAVYLQQTFQRVKSFSFHGVMRSIYSEPIDRICGILFDPTQGLELSTLPSDCGL